MTGFLPEKPGVIKMEVITEIRRLHFVENVTVSALAKLFKLSRPTIRKHLKMVEEPVYPVRKDQPHPKLGDYLKQLDDWLAKDAGLPRKQRRTAQRLFECLQVEGYIGGYTAVQRRVKDWNTKDTGHVCEKSITKQIDGRQTLTVYSNRSKANQALVLPGGKWTPHDLRRTGATMMGNIGIHGDVIEKCLNHTQENKLKRVYQHQELKTEQADAWRILGERLQLLTTQSSNVIPIKRAS